MMHPSLRNTQRMPMQTHVPDEELEATYEMEPPFYVNPVVAWRAWKVRLEPGGIVLASVTYNCDWPRREELRAACMSGRPGIVQAGHPSPDQKHGCGIYSVKLIEQAIRWATHGVSGAIRVIGEVKLWGRIFQYTEGYIAECAYPANILVPESYSHWVEKDWPDAEPEELAYLLEDAFGVPVGVGWPG